MTVSLYVRVVVKGNRRYVPVNKKKLYPDGTVFYLRYSRRWETLPADDLSTKSPQGSGFADRATLGC
jgi:hypothetical protein